MIKNDMTFKIGGEAGQGVESSGAGFAQALARGGLHIFGLQDYMSRIRGGHNFYQIRVKEEDIYSHTDAVHLLLALNPQAIKEHMEEVVEGGGIIYDESWQGEKRELEGRGIVPFPAPLKRIAEEEGGRKVMMNTAALGVAAGLTGYDFEPMASVIEDNFRKKGASVVERNLKVAETGYRFAQENHDRFGYRLETLEAPERMVINGNHAFCLGAVASGCRFISAYPMTPATSIMEWMAAHAQQYGIVMKQSEDEIAAICMAIGAAHVGARAMTATSGGGFSLMVEALGLAGMTETPLVVVEAQRPGPSTGLATRTEQGDLRFILHASQGEFPRLILAPGTVEECFQAGARAFNLAEKYQCPVIVVLDNFLANSLRAVDKGAFDFTSVEIHRGEFLTSEDLDRLEGQYNRFQFTESGISPRAVPSHPKAVYTSAGNVHDEQGHITEEPTIRTRMMNKRMGKLEVARREMREPELYGPKEADITFLGWGSTYGPIREAVEALNKEGRKVNFIHFMDIWPLPWEKVAEMMEGAQQTVAVENNYSGHMAGLIRTYTGREVDKRILKYDGRPFSPDYIIAHLEVK